MSAQQSTPNAAPDAAAAPTPASPAETPKPRELGGPKGLEPTRYGDWVVKGRCIDF